MATYASVDDVQAGYEQPIPDQARAVWGNKLDEAEEVLTAEVGDLATRIANGKTTAARIRIVLVRMVLRWARNPGGMRTETVGPFSYGRDSAVAAGRMFLTRDDRKLLGATSGPTTLTFGDDALYYPMWPPPEWTVPLSNGPELDEVVDMGELPLPEQP